MTIFHLFQYQENIHIVKVLVRVNFIQKLMKHVKNVKSVLKNVLFMQSAMIAKQLAMLVFHVLDVFKICPAHAKNMDNDKSYQEFAEAFSKKLEEPKKNDYFI